MPVLERKFRNDELRGIYEVSDDELTGFCCNLNLSNMSDLVQYLVTLQVLYLDYDSLMVIKTVTSVFLKKLVSFLSFQ